MKIFNYKDIFLSFKNAFKSTTNEQLSRLKNNAVTKVVDANNYYKEVTGLVVLDKYHRRVVELQDQLLDAQKRRRDIGNELTEIRKSSNLIQEELLKVKRQENFQMFLDLMKKETELLKRESEISQNFQEQDRMEREIFTAFTNAIRDSQERQQARAEYLKYWGLILTIVGSGASYIFSSLRTAELKDIVRKQGEKHFIEMKTVVAEEIQEGLQNNGVKIVPNKVQRNRSKDYEALANDLKETKLYMGKILQVINAQNEIINNSIPNDSTIEKYSQNNHSGINMKDPSTYLIGFFGVTATLYIFVKLLGG